ncbi:PfkB family carbohydrate kinase [candidate division KSB1 bacterium]
MSLLVVGSIAFDTILTPAGEGKDVLGGSAVHFTASSSFYTPTRVVGVVGEDFDHGLLQFLRDRNADLGGIYTERGKTFRWTGRYHKNMNERDSLATELNVFENFRPNIPESYRDSEYIFLANINPDLQSEVLDQVRRPVFTALDTMNFWIDGSREILEKVLARVDCVFLNDTEIQEFSGEHNLARAAKIVSDMGPDTIIIKKGEHGALMYHDSSFFVLPAYILESVIDPTGAGDSFAGGFMGYIAQRKDVSDSSLRNALAYGTCMASFCCEDFGSGRFKTLHKEEIELRVNDFKQLISL